MVGDELQPSDRAARARAKARGGNFVFIRLPLLEIGRLPEAANLPIKADYTCKGNSRIKKYRIWRTPEKWHRPSFEQSLSFKGLREKSHAIFWDAAIVIFYHQEALVAVKNIHQKKKCGKYREHTRFSKNHAELAHKPLRIFGNCTVFRGSGCVSSGRCKPLHRALQKMTRYFQKT